MIYLNANKALTEKNHHIVLFTLDILISFDISFRTIITNQLSGQTPDHKTINEQELNFVVLIQSYVNGFRITLLSDIVEQINSYYNDSVSVIKQDFKKAMQLYKKANDVNIYFISGIKALYKDRNCREGHTKNIYTETILALQELRNSFTKHLRELFSKTLATTS